MGWHGRDQELGWRVERMSLPACGEHALAEDEVDVAVLADAEADPHVHLGARHALALVFWVGRWVAAGRTRLGGVLLVWLAEGTMLTLYNFRLIMRL